MQNKQQLDLGINDSYIPPVANKPLKTQKRFAAQREFYIINKLRSLRILCPKIMLKLEVKQNQHCNKYWPRRAVIKNACPFITRN